MQRSFFFFFARLFFQFEPRTSAQLANFIIIILVVEIDPSGGCVGLLWTCVIQTFPITPEPFSQQPF